MVVSEKDDMAICLKGSFVKIIMPGDADIMLAQGLSSRPAARFNRAGQDALYLGSGPINLAHSARAVLRKDKKENRGNVVHFQDFTT
ncbi:MAG: hypothetical protein OIF58_12625 [Cohaesibacter sp.]|nr:hypothetical protein [Cohaesibacter sp.]